MKRVIRLTAPEWLILSGVLCLVLTPIITGIMAYRLHRNYQSVRDELAAIERACALYFDEYGRWPSDHDPAFGDVRYGREFPNANVVNALRAVSGPGNFNHTMNPGRIIMLEADKWRSGRSGLDRNGNFLDAWGAPYQLVLDVDLNNRCDIERSIYTRVENAGAVVWSCGPDGISDTSDDLLGWEQTNQPAVLNEAFPRR